MNNTFKKFFEQVEKVEELYEVYKTLSPESEQPQFLAKVFAEDELLGTFYKEYKGHPTSENKRMVQKEFNNFCLMFRIYDYMCNFFSEQIKK